MNEGDVALLLGIGVVVAAGVAVFARYPPARRWIAAAVVFLLGLVLALPFVIVAAIQNMDTDGSLEQGPLLVAAAIALVGTAMAAMIVWLGGRTSARRG